jgi:HlyD family secretion protein
MIRTPIVRRGFFFVLALALALGAWRWLGSGPGRAGAQAQPSPQAGGASQAARPGAPGGRPPAGPPGRPPVAVALAPVVEETIQDRHEVVGTVEADLVTTVAAEVAGQVAAAPVEEGDRVVAGKTVLAQLGRTDREIAVREAGAALLRARQVLAELKAGSRKEELAARRAAVAERRAALEQKERDLKRLTELHAQRVIAAAELQRTESEHQSTKAQVERAEAELALAEAGPRAETVAAQEAEAARLAAALERAEDLLRKTTVLAPVTGYVTALHTEVGQWVGEGGKIADVVSIDQVLVRVDVNERDIGRVKVGQPATVTTDAYPERTFTGTVSRIVPLADAQSRGFPVRVKVTNPPDRPLKAGMFARVTLQSGQARPALLVPRDALVTNRGAQPVVFTVQEGVARALPVTVRASRGDRVAVQGEGLARGTMIVVAGQATLSDGAPVMVGGGPGAAPGR